MARAETKRKETREPAGSVATVDSLLDGEETDTGTEPTMASDLVRQRLGDLLARAAHRDQRIVITIYGRKQAALIGMRDLRRLRKLDEEEKRTKRRKSDDDEQDAA